MWPLPATCRQENRRAAERIPVAQLQAVCYNDRMRCNEEKGKLMADIVTAVIRDLKRANPMYNQFVFDKVRDFLKELYADREIAPKGSYATRSDLLFDSGQGFLTGYGAAVDGEYDEGRTEVAEDVAGQPWWREVVRSLGEREPHPFTLARASMFLSTAAGVGCPDPFLYYAGYGFVVGFERGIAGLSTGEVDYLADDAEERKRFAEFVKEAAREAVDDCVFADILRIDTAIGWFNGIDEYDEDDDCDEDDDLDDDDFDDDDDDGDGSVLYDDDGWESTTAEHGDVGELMRAMAASAIAYVTNISTGRSGWHHASDEVVYSRIQTYVASYVDGFCDQAFGCLPDPEEIEELAADVSGTYERFGEEFGADYSIAQDVRFGRLGAEDESLAKAAMRHTLDEIVAEIPDDVLRQISAPEDVFDLPIPDAADCFWTISGLAYACGARKASDDHREASDAALAFYEAESEDAYDIEYVDYIDGPDDMTDIDYPAESAMRTIPVANGGTLTEQFFAIGNEMGGSTDDWLAALSSINAQLVAKLGLGLAIDEDEVVELARAVRELCRITPKLKRMVDHNWEFAGGPLVYRMADDIEAGRAARP